MQMLWNVFLLSLLIQCKYTIHVFSQHFHSFQENISTAPLYFYGYLLPTVAFDPSAVVLLLIAVVTVFLGSFIANTPYEFMRYFPHIIIKQVHNLS